MKKLLLATVMLLFTLTIVSCDSSKKKLNAAIEAVNEECPVDIGITGEFSEATYDMENNVVALTFTLSEQMPMKPSALNRLKNTIKRCILSGWVSDEESKKIVKMMVDADSRLCVVVNRNGKTDNLEIEVANSELKEIANGKVDSVSPREMLDVMAATVNAQCPIRVDNATIMSSAAIEGNNFVYNYSINENVVDVDELGEGTGLKEHIIQGLRCNDPAVNEFLENCKKANVSLAYRYTGNQTGKTCFIKVDASEL